MKVKLYSISVSRKNGGSSSLLDLANCIIDCGQEVSFYTVLGKLDYIIYRPSDVSKELSLRPLPYKVVKTMKISPFKKSMNFLLGFLFYSPLSKHEFDGDLIIDGIGLAKYFRQYGNGSCMKVLNHAGSVNAYLKYFGGEHRGGSKEEALIKENYLKMLDSYDRVMFQSESQAAYLKEILCESKGVASAFPIVLKPSVSTGDINSAHLGKVSPYNESEFNVVIVGSVQERKGQKDIVKMLQLLINKIPNIKINVVGNILEQGYKESIDQDLERWSLSNYVIFHGFKRNYLLYIKFADVVVQLSREEGVSRVLREAMALRLPICSYELDGTADLLENKFDSLLYPIGNVERLTEGLVDLAKDPEYRSWLANNAYKNFNNKYSYDSYKSEVTALLDMVE